MLRNLLFYFEIISFFLLGVTVAYFVSSLVYLKYPDVGLLKISKEDCDIVTYSYSTFLSREGFFKSKGLKKRKISIPVMEETFSLGDYTLKGTVVCSQCDKSIAILEENGKSKILSVGEELKGYKLIRVYPDRVVFSKDSREIILMLRSLKERRGERKSRNKKEDREFSVKRKEIIKQIASGEFLRYINIVPIKNPAGLKVNYVNPQSFVYRLGIRPGDVILSINDVRIRTPEDSFSAFEQLKNADSVVITVYRNGKELKLKYELE